MSISKIRELYCRGIIEWDVFMELLAIEYERLEKVSKNGK